MDSAIMYAIFDTIIFKFVIEGFCICSSANNT